MTTLEQTQDIEDVRSGNLRTQVKALLWEECRTGGAIAALCLTLGMVFVLEAWLSYRAYAWTEDAQMVSLAVFGMPIVIGLLLILNPNNSGHLVGGFSSRILRLPVQTSTAVAVSLFSRIALVFVSTLILVCSSILLFEESPGLNTVLWITLFYLLFQVLDWLRPVLSGLTSVVILVVVLILVSVITEGFDDTRNFANEVWLTRYSTLFLALSILVALAAVYFLAVRAVHADRIGRRYGFPEVWQWPRIVSFSSSRARSPFSSPLAAQVWFELRRSKGWLPLGTFSLGIFGLIVLWIFIPVDSPDEVAPFVRIFSSFSIFWIVLLLAAVQGAYTRVLGIRSSFGNAGFEYLQPLTSAQCAQARVIANVLLLLPTIVVCIVVHFALGGVALLTETIPESLRLGITSWREVVWILVSRGLLIGVSAWALLAIGTRTFRRGIVILFALILVNLAVVENIRFTNTVIGFLLTIVTIGLMVHALHQAVVPRRSIFAWAGVWFLFVWLFHYAFTTVWFQMHPSVFERLLGISTATGFAAIVPLAYLGWELDIRRKRHGSARHQDPAQHGQSVPLGQFGKGRMAIAAAVICGVLWLGWPANPGYVQFRRDQGLPVTLSELNDSYVEPEENVALDYVELSQEHNELYAAFHNGKRRGWPTDIDNDYINNLLVVGNAELSRDEPISREVWNATEEHWNAVTSKIVPPLRELANRNEIQSRYPIDLNGGYAMEIPHLAGLRSLAQGLHLDVLHWSVVADTENAKNSMLSQFSVADSLVNEPLFISQLIRIAITSITTVTLEDALNRMEFTDAELAELQQACESALAADSGMRRAMTSESLFMLSALHSFAATWGSNVEDHGSNATLFLWQLFYPASAECMTYLSRMEETMQSEERSWAENSTWNETFRQDISEQSVFMSPVTGIMLPGLSRTYESVWRNRMQLETARAALAVDRYRLAQGRLPDALDALVPDFLSEVPTDYFDANQSPLRYIVREDGEFVVYSLDRDMEDDQNVDKSLTYGIVEDQALASIDDITFTVAPLAVRNGPHVKAE